MTFDHERIDWKLLARASFETPWTYIQPVDARNTPIEEANGVDADIMQCKSSGVNIFEISGNIAGALFILYRRRSSFSRISVLFICIVEWL